MWVIRSSSRVRGALAKWSISNEISGEMRQLFFPVARGRWRNIFISLISPHSEIGEALDEVFDGGPKRSSEQAS